MKKLILLVAIAIACMPLQVSAVGSRLTQTIEPIDCTNTNTDNGITINESIACDGVTSPTVISRTYTMSAFRLSGTIGGMQWRTLRVLFLGHWYVYGQDAELTVTDGVWQLAVADVPAGTYTVTVEVVTTDNQLVRGENTITVAPASPPKDTGKHHSGGKLVDTGEDVVLYAGIAAVVVLIGLVLVLLAWRRRKG